MVTDGESDAEADEDEEVLSDGDIFVEAVAKFDVGSEVGDTEAQLDRLGLPVVDALNEAVEVAVADAD